MITEITDVVEYYKDGKSNDYYDDSYLYNDGPVYKEKPENVVVYLNTDQILHIKESTRNRKAGYITITLVNDDEIEVKFDGCVRSFCNKFNIPMC